MDGQVEIKEEPAWDDEDEEGAELQPPLEVYLKTEYCDEQESYQRPREDAAGSANGPRYSLGANGDCEEDDDDICHIHPDVVIHTPDVDPLQFPGAPSEPEPESEQTDQDARKTVGTADPSQGAAEKPGEVVVVQGVAFSCPGCPMSYSSLAYLQTHVKYCRKLKPARRKAHKPSRFSCEVCGRQTSTHSNHKQHLLLHSGARPYACLRCPSSFARKADLNRHALAHRGERPYACAVCGARFAQGAHLTQHRRVHTGDRPYACEVCGDSFANKSNLTTHRRQHRGERPYSCAVCGMTFAQSTHATTHTRRVHGAANTTVKTEVKTEIKTE